MVSDFDNDAEGHGFNSHNFRCQIVQAVVGLPSNTHVALRETGVKLLGELADWLNASQDRELARRFS